MLNTGSGAGMMFVYILIKRYVVSMVMTTGRQKTVLLKIY